jgi:hypothetical protein
MPDSIQFRESSHQIAKQTSSVGITGLSSMGGQLQKKIVKQIQIREIYQERWQVAPKNQDRRAESRKQ